MMIRAAASQCACGGCRPPSNGAPALGSTVAAARYCDACPAGRRSQAPKTKSTAPNNKNLNGMLRYHPQAARQSLVDCGPKENV
jgi:hypothetical protein